MQGIVGSFIGRRPYCFVIMPFRSAYWFYRYVGLHLETRFGIECRRGDEIYSTRPIHDKLMELIERADFVLADCTRFNPNVCYELGLAYRSGKKAILIRRDDPSSAPADFRDREFLRYTPFEEGNFLSELDNAICRLICELRPHGGLLN